MEATPGAIRNGSDETYDPMVASHWAQWLCDPHPDLVIVGQDFGNFDYFVAFRGADDPRNETNMQLYGFLLEAGLSPGTPVDRDANAKVFLTNTILCFKTSPQMNAPVKQMWARDCLSLHLNPLLALLKPKAVVALGSTAWKALRRYHRLTHSPEQMLQAAGSSWPTEHYQLFANAHCGRLGQANRAHALQKGDWQRIGAFLGYR